MTRFILIPSGETDWDRAGRFTGRADVPLNDAGCEQARRLSARLAREKIAAVYASALVRAMQTGQAVAEPHHLPVVVEMGLLDLDYGQWEGRTPQDVAATDPKRYAQWLAQPERVKIPNGETLRDLRRHVMDTIAMLAPKLLGETVVLVSHEIPCRVLLCAALGLNHNAIGRIEQRPTALNVFLKRDQGFVVTAMNDIAHLDAANILHE